MKLTLKNLYTLFGLDKVDWKKATTRLLVVLWGTLLISWILKIFLGNSIFEIYTNNELFKNICHKIEQNALLVKIYPYPFYLLSCYLPILIISREKPKKWNLWFLLPITGLYILKIFYPSISYILELVMYVILSIKVSKRPWRALELFVFTIIFQFISLVTKNIGYKLDYENLVISSIFMIDYYIMMLIYCVNTLIRKESVLMGLFGPWLLSKKGDQLVAYRTKLLDKRAKIDAEIKEIDREIENEKNKVSK